MHFSRFFLLLAALAAAVLSPASAWATLNGQGTSADPYQISSAARKLLLEGRVVILRAGHFYDPSGRLLQ